MSKRMVEVRLLVEVEVDASKFTEEFMTEFRDSFYPFYDVDDHVCHIAQLKARGLLNPEFIEGYGPAAEMGIEARVVDVLAETEVQESEGC